MLQTFGPESLGNPSRKPKHFGNIAVHCPGACASTHPLLKLHPRGTRSRNISFLTATDTWGYNFSLGPLASLIGHDIVLGIVGEAGGLIGIYKKSPEVGRQMVKTTQSAHSHMYVGHSEIRGCAVPGGGYFAFTQIPKWLKTVKLCFHTFPLAPPSFCPEVVEERGEGTRKEDLSGLAGSRKGLREGL